MDAFLLQIDTYLQSSLIASLAAAFLGGLLASQVLTLLTTPVVYVLLDKLRRHPVGVAKLARGIR